MITVFNPAPISPEIVKIFPFDNVDCLILNKIESLELYSKITTITDTSTTSSSLLSSTLSDYNQQKKLLLTIKNKFPQLKILIVTLGYDGLIAWFKHFNSDDEIRTFPIHEPKDGKPVLDTTAAGDTFIGFFVASISRNLQVTGCSLDNLSLEQIEEGIKEGIIAASLSVRKIGAMDSIPYLDEVYQEKG